MALARLALKKLQHRVSTSCYLLSEGVNSNIERQRWGCEGVKRFSDVAVDKKESEDEKSQGAIRDDQVAVGESGDKKWKGLLNPKRRRRRGLLRHWKDDSDDHEHARVPSLYEFFPSGLGHAMAQATENVNRLLQNLVPSHRVKEHDERYVLRFPVPGLAKEDVKITIEEGFLVIRGEHKEEGTDDDNGGFSVYEFYDDTRLVLPEDAKVDEIKAELKDGLLTVTIPRIEEKRRDVKEIQIH